MRAYVRRSFCLLREVPGAQIAVYSGLDVFETGVLVSARRSPEVWDQNLSRHRSVVGFVLTSTTPAKVVLYALARAPHMDGATAGLALSYSLSVTQALTFTIKQHAQVEIAANALERADEYARLPRERSGGAAPPTGWPSAGALVYEAVDLAYPSAPRTLALRGVSFAVAGGAKLGVCGRTGAGKSSLVAALLRLVEPAGGRILIDGVDAAGLDLGGLRRAPSVWKSTTGSDRTDAP